MKYGLLAIVSLFGVCVLRADDASAAAGVPERAAAVYSVVDGQKLGIVAFEDDYPVVLSKGARLTQTEPRVMLVPAPGFAAGLVTVDRTEKTTSESVLGNSLLSVDNVKQDVVSFTAKVTADRGLGDVYLLMLAYEDLGGSYAEAPKFAILGKGIGRLEAGQTVKVAARFPKLMTNKPVRRAVLVFSGPSQVRSSEGNGVLDAYFDTVDRVGYQRMLAERYAGSHPLAVYRGFGLAFGDETKRRYAGRTVRVHIAVAASGALDHVDLEDITDAALADAFSRQLRSWLFLPRVVDGVAQGGTIVLPMKF